ncbi:hypothetical protein JYB64_07995 [Algoriphagus aestuarii]|nr:hypothetical protein [Algoriphagus aestuarii]
MKKYLFIIGLGAMIFNSSCDSQNEEALFADVDQAVAENNPNARLGGTSSGGLGSGKVSFNYEIAENSYLGVMNELPPSKAEEVLRNSRSREGFLMTMILESLEIFDSTLMKRGATFSYQAKRNHEAMAGGEHEIEYDIASAPQAAAAGYLKIGDIKGESTDREYYFAKVFSGNGATSAPSRSPWEDSIPPIKQPELEETAEFVLGLNARNIDPASIGGALNDLQLSAGVDPVAIGMLLPAVQKIRESAAADPRGRGKADILIESLGFYGLSLEDDLSNLYKIGGMGSIGQLASDSYDDSGDKDWATIQLNRRKFEFEMLFIWSRFWDNHQAVPGTGR